MKKLGTVFLVGAGPGDPGLITVKGVACLEKADVVVYDYLANSKFLDLAPAKARRVYVGKKGASHSKEQEEINALMVAEARRGRTVVRLKGGDPFVFGRGGEEAEALAEAGVPFEVVPGVTSAIAVPAYAGIPVTHRNFGSAVAIVTGHEKDDEGAYAPDWGALAKIGNVVFLMGYGNLPHIVENLKKAGMEASTPAAVIEWGTLPRQKKATGTLATIVEAVRENGIKPPTVIVVGKIASLGEKLAWFEKKPLLGRRIVVTRSRNQASEISRLLEEKGAEVIERPTLEILPPSSWSALDRAIQRLSSYDWVAFTSANGVASFFARLGKMKKDLRHLRGVKFAAVGPATARPIAEKGIVADLVADEFRGIGLAQKMIRAGVRGKKILLVQTKQASPDLREVLKKAGAKVETAEAYRSVMPRVGAQGLAPLQGADLIVFASSLTVENFVKAGGAGAAPVACIGPVTAKTARALGLNVAVVPKKSTMPDLVDAIAAYFRKN
ncbi:MAG TPA: uroporphyrinogen-III C-methyltransferase [bacterium]|nr:uroporphyrinogen-III C-methyltransferase [bacterium]